VSFLRTAVEYLLGGPKVGGASEDRLRRWAALPAAQLALPHGRTRYVVVVPATARHALRHDRLISIGAVGVGRAQLDLADCFAAVLRQPRARADADVLRHGVGAEAQLAGVDPKHAMLDFLDFVGKAPLVAFGAGVARPVVERAVKSILGVPFRPPWLDLAALLPALFRESRCASRDEWQHRFGIAAGTRPDVLADAYATAQLLLAALDAAARAGWGNAAQLIALQERRGAAVPA
jgi:DNA polymerase-3 subunit epsilon